MSRKPIGPKWVSIPVMVIIGVMLIGGEVCAQHSGTQPVMPGYVTPQSLVNGPPTGFQRTPSYPFVQTVPAAPVDPLAQIIPKAPVIGEMAPNQSEIAGRMQSTATWAQLRKRPVMGAAAAGR